MRRQFSSMLLCGAKMTMMTAAVMAAQVMAQTTTANTAPKFPLDVAVTYDATLSNAITGKSFWMQGGSVQVHGQFYRGLGVVADIAGMHTGNINSSGVGLDMVTATFGPRYTWSPAHARCALFGQALVGDAIGFNSVFPGVKGVTDTSYNLAVKAGGGMNIALSPRLALRAFEANWVRTELPNSTTNVQNNVSLGTGVVMRFR